MRSLLAFVTLSLGLLSLAEPTVSPYSVHEKRSHVPAGWALSRRHESGAVLPLRFALAQRNIDDIGTFLMEVSHPKSTAYGKHWSAGDVLKTFAPSDETIDAVRTWLIESGIDEERISVSSNKGWVEVDATREEAESLLQTEYNVYSHATGKEHVACDSYQLPAHIAPHVDFVTPTVHFDARISRRSTTEPARKIGAPGSSGPKTTGKFDGVIADDLSTCNEYITLDCLRTLYSLGDYAPQAADKNSYGIVEYTPEAYLQTDINMFAMNFSEGLYGVAPYMVSIDGGYAQTEYTGFDYNGESDLDLQYGMGLVTPAQQVTLYQAGDMVEGASFNNFLDALDGSYCTFEGGDDYTQDAEYPDYSPGGYEGPEACGTATPTYVISTSYSYNEADLTPFYTARQCAEYAKLGLMGVTVLYSSGDYGVAGNDALCLNANGTQSTNGIMFNPSFPGTCPYITSVGATMIAPNSTVYEPETACEEVIYSGGGFSNYFAMPDYQKEAVAYYLETYPPDYPADIWNSTGMSRAFPDISANGANYVVAIDGEFELVYGTSCSSPVSGAIFTLINDARLAAGKSTIGFINPTIYSTDFSGLFNDITTGDNPGCGTNGYNATPGWDPVTGLGTPNFAKLVEAWLALD
ncbi:peptidase S8/S53 domain-containing protein [Hygrophoropsis aurantiaca]|uniref:Peptidase S8/S53 domain-containing protein n=1 Tax=Hygrophoropsis aurantiaca TaxID=72124 RepID=A0ACB8A4V8_9AGAM|nr:peptidase S8/S53 domain-containing protein [Hygrophoropsis aurantiaca]